VTAAPVPDQVRLAELLGVLSLGADLGLGQPMEHALRQCVIARRMGEHLGLADADLDAMYYLGLVVWVGCHVDVYEQAKWFGAVNVHAAPGDPLGGVFVAQRGG
jgi:hypothetical protein